MPEYYLAGILFLVLCIYLLTGGADFGGGILDLLCVGHRSKDQRHLIANRIAPIWEANHVWLILIIVLLFVCFPPVFETISIALNIPLTIMLLGITFRGTAFVFRSHDLNASEYQKRWNVLFAIGSIITPLMLGICLGSVASGFLPTNLTGKEDFWLSYVAPWTARFPLLVGLLTLWLCGFLASLYAVNGAQYDALKQDFRYRAMAFGVLIAFTGIWILVVAKIDAPLIYRQLLGEPWSLALQIFTACAAAAVFIALWLRHDLLATLAGILEVICILCGWAFSQFPYMIVSTHTIINSSASPSILNPVLAALGIGALALIPSFGWLYWVFRK
ncbi:MAG: cytochrome d ubiquinol oxidase subunit II [Myxococcota bacterium]